jgi:hypothetical protein
MPAAASLSHTRAFKTCGPAPPVSKQRELDSGHDWELGGPPPLTSHYLSKLLKKQTAVP